MGYSLLVGLWVIWCALHSALVSNTVVGFFKKRMGAGFRFYRLLYCIFSCATLVPLVVYSVTLQSELFFTWDGYLVIIRYLLLITGLSLFIAGGRHYDLLRLIGIRQVTEGETDNKPRPDSGLEVTGILGVTRHPWYLGGIILVWAGDLTLTGLIINLILSTYFIIGTYLEESKLVKEFGDEYREYQKRVSMLFPFKWLKSVLG